MSASQPHPEVVFTEGELLTIFVEMQIAAIAIADRTNLSSSHKVRAKIISAVGRTSTFQDYCSKGGDS